jgi:hypothetical protein
VDFNINCGAWWRREENEEAKGKYSRVEINPLLAIG